MTESSCPEVDGCLTRCEATFEEEGAETRLKDSKGRPPLEGCVKLLACGCNFHGQLFIDNEMRISYLNALKADFDDLAREQAFKTLEKPTEIMFGRKHIRILYLDWSTLLGTCV